MTHLSIKNAWNLIQKNFLISRVISNPILQRVLKKQGTVFVWNYGMVDLVATGQI